MYEEFIPDVVWWVECPRNVLEESTFVASIDAVDNNTVMDLAVSEK